MERENREETYVMAKNSRSGFRVPGHKIDPDAWRRFKSSGDWKSAPDIFDDHCRSDSLPGLVAEEGDRVPILPEGSAGEGAGAYFGVRMTSARRIFADELDKEVLIGVMTSESIRFRYDIVDFIVLDDDVRMVLRRRTSGSREVKGEEDLLSDMVRCIRRRYLEALPEKRKGRSQDLERGSIAVLGRWQQALEECCRIHYLTVERGIVSSAVDMKRYWFSGYVTLHGNYCWNCVRPRGFLMELADYPADALRRYERAHRSYVAARRI